MIGSWQRPNIFGKGRSFNPAKITLRDKKLKATVEDSAAKAKDLAQQKLRGSIQV